jgi:surface antigen
VEVSVHVNGRKRGLKRLFATGSVTFATEARTTTPGDPEPVTTVSGTVGGKGGYSCASAEDGYRSVLDASTYCTGYCTWWVWQQRPEQALKNLGDAWQWYQNTNLPKSKTAGPVVGAVAWWGQGAGALSDGHVAYVTGDTATTVTVTEMNVKGWDVEDSRTFALGSSTAPQGYIYGGPAGNGPSTGGATNPGGGTGSGGSGTPSGTTQVAPGSTVSAVSKASGDIDAFFVTQQGCLDDFWDNPSANGIDFETCNVAGA